MHGSAVNRTEQANRLYLLNQPPSQAQRQMKEMLSSFIQFRYLCN